MWQKNEPGRDVIAESSPIKRESPQWKHLLTRGNQVEIPACSLPLPDP
jgi:hypothetical protein